MIFNYIYREYFETLTFPRLPVSVFQKLLTVIWIYIKKPTHNNRNTTKFDGDIFKTNLKINLKNKFRQNRRLQIIEINNAMN